MTRRALTRRILVTCLRFLVLALSVHFGALALVAITDESCTEESDCCSDCPIEGSGQECPPGCPNCHCHHASGAVAIPELDGKDLALPSRDQGTERGRPQAATAPREPALPSVFRPPRPRTFFT